MCRMRASVGSTKIASRPASARIGFLGAAMALITALPITVGNAGSVGDSERGLQLARHWCASCHLVEGRGTGSDVAPPFSAISRDPSLTPGRLHAWLARPHPPMPDVKLTRADEDDIIAYLQQLRSQ